MMNDQELMIGVDLSLFDIAVITGWSIPDHDIFRTKLKTQLSLKFQESYGDLTLSEISYAMRNYGVAVEDYGKALNLSLIDKVIVMYRKEREEVSAAEETNKINTQRVFSEEELQDYARQTAQMAYSLWLKKIKNDNIQTNISILVKDGYMPDGGDVEVFFQKMQDLGVTNLYVHR